MARKRRRLIPFYYGIFTKSRKVWLSKKKRVTLMLSSQQCFHRNHSTTFGDRLQNPVRSIQVQVQPMETPPSPHFPTPVAKHPPMHIYGHPANSTRISLDSSVVKIKTTKKTKHRSKMFSRYFLFCECNEFPELFMSRDI